MSSQVNESKLEIDKPIPEREKYCGVLGS